MSHPESQHPQQHQPEAKPAMSLSPDMQKKLKDAATSDEAKKAAKEAISYEKEHGQDQMNEAQQKYDDAKAQAEGMWAKYCGCFSS